MENMPTQLAKFDRINVQDGISQNTVNCLLKDSSGFMWFGTEDGLNRYDGFKFQVYKHSNKDPKSISGNHIYCIMEDRHGYIWVGTSDAGLNRFDRVSETFESFKHDPKVPGTLAHNSVLSILEDHEGIIWVGTGGGGLNRFNPKSKTFSVLRHNPTDVNSLSGNNIRSLLEIRPGELWAATLTRGLNAINTQTMDIKRFQHEPSNPKSLASNQIMALVARQNELWIATDSEGLDRFDAATGNFQHLKDTPHIPNASLQTLAVDRLNRIWIGTQNHGLVCYDPQSETSKHFEANVMDPLSISSNQIRCIYQDDTGILWIGTWMGGLNKWVPSKVKFNHLRKIPGSSNTLSSGKIWSITQDSMRNLWVTTWGGGVNQIDLDTLAVTHHRAMQDGTGLNADFVYGIVCDSNDDIWVGGVHSTLNHYQRQTKTWAQYPLENIHPKMSKDLYLLSLHLDHAGSIWIGTNQGGLFQFDPVQKSFRCFQSDPPGTDIRANNVIRHIFEDDNQNLWLATDRGIKVFNKRDQSFSYINHTENGLSSDAIRCIYKDPGGIYWIGTKNGLNRFDPQTSKFTHFLTEDGLPNQVVYGVLPDQAGNLWLSTNNGLSRFSPISREFKNFGTDDGLQSLEFNGGAFYRNKDGTLYFGGINGVNYFNPEHIDSDPTLPIISLTGMRIINTDIHPNTMFKGRKILSKSITLTDQVDLYYSDSVVTFEFSSMHFAEPKRNHHAYRLEGFDSEWNDIGQRRFATFTNLPPGTYSLRLKGSNQDGIWTELKRPLTLVVHPPFWMTWWFRLGIFSLGLGLFILIYNVRTHQIKAHARALQKEIDDRKRAEEQLFHSQKLEGLGQLASGIAHDFNNILTAMNGFTEMAQLLSHKQPDPKLGHYLDQVKECGDRAVSLVKQLLAFSRKEVTQPQALEVNQSIGKLEKMLRRLIPSSIQLTTKCANRLPEIEADPSQFQQVLINIVVNARDALNHRKQDDPQKEITIETECVKIDAFQAAQIPGLSQGDHIKIVIRDNGSGMTESTRSRLFEPFFTTKQVGEGTGLGLSTVYGIVTQNGGAIKVESQLGEGSSFIVFWPCMDLEKVIENATSNRQEIVGGHEHIIFVEDDPYVRSVGMEYLKQLGYQLTVFESGNQAWTELMNEKGSFDLLFTDMMMPGINGAELAKRVKIRYPNIKTLYCSGYSNQVLNDLEFDAIERYFLKKPYSRETLARKLRQVLEE